MKSVFVLVTFLLAAAGGLTQTAAPSFVPGTPADEAAIRAILAREETGDRSQLPNDLDWENAFGIRYTDEKKRAAFYHAAVDPLQTQSVKATLETRIKFVTPTVAIADVYGHRVGQIDQKTGKAGADRWGRNTYIFKKENGVWIEVAERIADLRYPWYKHYDALPAASPVPAATLANYPGTYASADGKEIGTVTVDGDHLMLKSKTGERTLIPTSGTEFLGFHPDDLAEYIKVSFSAGPDGKTVLMLASEVGEPIVTGAKVR